MAADKTIKEKIEEFLQKFPKDATCWSQATDEIRDMARTSREYLEVYENIVVGPLNFRVIHSPSAWNTAGRDYIMSNLNRMNPHTQKIFFDRFCAWLEPRQAEAEIPARRKRRGLKL